MTEPRELTGWVFNGRLARCDGLYVGRLSADQGKVYVDGITAEGHVLRVEMSREDAEALREELGRLP